MILRITAFALALLASPREPIPAIARLDGYEAEIRRTTNGVAHIRANDLGSLGFGEGYAQAEDHLCTIADQIVRVRGERARYFGRGERDVHVISDAGMRALRLAEDADALHAAQPAEVREWVNGFVAGYNLYLTETGRDAVPGWCRGEEWVVPIRAADLAAYGRMLGLTTPAFATAMAAARPPSADGESGAFPPAADALEVAARRSTASNGWALGRELTGGGGILLANPHYPWSGANRFWEKHLTIPGDLDVYGVNLIGLPGVLIGFTEAVAWTHTISAGTRFTLYALELVPGSPTRYRYGDEVREMRSVEVVVEVRGETEPVRQTAWMSHYGPIVAPAGMPWTAERAFTVRDAAEHLPGYTMQLLETNRARSLAELQRAYAAHQAVPRFTTVAVDRDGTAWFVDASATPNVSEFALRAWTAMRERDAQVRQLWEVTGMMLLDGSDPRFEWVDEPASAVRGIVPWERIPQLERTDYVFNANNSFWIANVRAPLDGDHSILHGLQRSPLSLRARQNIRYLSGDGMARTGGAGGRFDAAAVRDAVLGNRSLAADLLVPELLQRCTEAPGVELEEGSVDLRHACGVLAAWDRRFDLDSRGAVLFREWLARYDGGSTLRVRPGQPNLFAHDFDAGDPAGTPHGLAPGGLALANLARAVMLLTAQGIALDTPLGDLQFTPAKLPGRLQVHGGNNAEGVLNLQLGSHAPTTLEPVHRSRPVPGSRVLTEDGYPVLHGSSFVLVVEMTSDGPRGSAILTYGQSGDPESPHFTDQTEMFARKEWRPVLFREDDIAPRVERRYTVSQESAQR